MAPATASSSGGCKLILLGNGSVGKSSIVARFVDDGFAKVYKQTVGLDFFEKEVTLPRGPRRRMVLQVWDIGGQSVGSANLPKYVHGSNAVMLCYDVTDESSFQDAEDWLRLARRALAGSSAKIFLVGNKIDLYGQRAVSEKRHETFIAAHSLDGGHFCSAKSGESVVRTFYQLAGEIAGITLSPYELSFHDKVITKVEVSRTSESGIDADGDEMTEMERRIMEEDAALEAAKRRKENRRRSSSSKKCLVM